MNGLEGWILPLALILGGGATIAVDPIGIGGHSPVPGELSLGLAAGVVVSGCIVLLPPLRPGLWPSVRGAVLGASAFLLLSAWWAPQPIPVLLRMAGGVGVLLFALGSICSLLSRFTGSRQGAAWWVILATGIFSSIPIWSGPLVEAVSPGREVIDAIIASSPLSYLATLAEWDYLRGEWFYRHTPFGGFRYDYPSAIAGSLMYLGGGLACHLTNNLLASGKDPESRLRRPATPLHP